jgi:glycosyltransferase involved in cell wall biosynthesis
MKICTVFYGLEEFGGLEELAKDLALAIHAQGQEISLLSCAWVPPENQYVRAFRAQGIRYVQPPKWLSYPAADWETKERILAAVMWLATPLVYVLGLLRWLKTRDSWQASRQSARNWLRGRLMRNVIGRDGRPLLGRWLLAYWRWRWRYDVLHIHGYTTNLLFAIEWAARRGLAVVYEEHQTPDPQFDWWKSFEKSINQATVVVAVSEASAQGLRSVCGVTRPIVVAYPPVPSPPATARQRMEPPPGERRPLRLTTIARLYVTKGLGYLLEAGARVRRIQPAVEFRIFGDGPLRDELTTQAHTLGLDPEAIFMGAFDHRDLPAIMRETDIFVMSSILEGQPLAVVEAMAYGCPMVVTAVGGIPELIKDGDNGLLVAPADAEALAEAILRLIEDEDLRRRLGQAARQTYESGPFQPAAVATHYINVYQQAIALNSAGGTKLPHELSERRAV